MVAPGRKTNGGITKVVSYYENSSFWKKEDVIWIETHRSGNALLKIGVLIKALILFIKYAGNAKICHIHFAGGNSARRKYIFYCLSRVFDLKIVSHLHEPGGTEFNLRENRAFNKLISKSDKVLVLSKAWKEVLEKMFNRELIVLNNPSNGFLEDFSMKKSKILFAGTLNERKGFVDLIMSLAQIDTNLLSQFEVVIAGDGEIEKAKSLISVYGLRTVTVTGWLHSEKILDQFKTAQIFILPSYAEGFPISIIDAMSNACAIITTPVGGIPDFLTNGINCLFVSSGDTIEIADALSKLMFNSDLRIKLGANAFNLAKQEFDIDVITTKLSEVYNDLCSN